MPEVFIEKYGLDDKELYKKKMLIEIFKTDTEGKGWDKIKLLGISENEKELFVDYTLINSDTTNDQPTLAPFLIVQIPKSKKNIVFSMDGKRLGEVSKIYID